MSRKATAAIAISMAVAIGPIGADERTSVLLGTGNNQRSLSFQHLNGQNFAGADLRRADLVMTRFHGANLRGADFTGASMDRTELADADLSYAIGLGTVNYGLGVHAQRANFQHADLAGARIPGTYFEGADFRHANLRDAILSGRFHDAKFDDADVSNTVLLGAAGIESLHKELQARGAIVDANDFVQSIRKGRDFAGCDLSGFQLTGADLARAPFSGATLHSANLVRASLRNARLAGANLCWAKASGAALNGADLSQAKLIGTVLTDADLTNANCRSAEFCQARLRGANFRNADLTAADFRGAELTGVDFTDAILTDVKWDAAIVADLKGLRPDEQAELKSKAARWKHDLAEGFQRAVRAFSTPVWLMSWVLGAVIYVRGWLRSPRPCSLTLLTSLHVVASLPAVVVLFMFFGRVSPTVQMTGSYAGWSAWVGAWPLVVGVTLLALAGFLPIGVVAWVKNSRSVHGMSKTSFAAAMLLTGTALAASLGAMMLLAPTV